MQTEAREVSLHSPACLSAGETLRRWDWERGRFMLMEADFVCDKKSATLLITPVESIKWRGGEGDTHRTSAKAPGIVAGCPLCLLDVHASSPNSIGWNMARATTVAASIMQGRQLLVVFHRLCRCRCRRRCRHRT